MGNMRRLSSTVAGLVLLALFLICAPQPAHAQLMETTMGAYPLIIGKSIHLYHLPINETNDYSYVIFELDGELRNVSHGACTNTSLITSTCKLDPPFVGTGIVYGAFDDSPSKVPVAFANRVYQSSGTEPIVIPGHYGDPEQDVIFEGPKGFQSQVTCARNDEGTVLTCPPLGAVTYSGLYQVVVPSNGFIPATYEAWALVVPTITENRASVDRGADPLIISFSGYGFGDASLMDRTIVLSEGNCSDVELIEPPRPERGYVSGLSTIKCTVNPATPLTSLSYLSATMSTYEAESWGYNHTDWVNSNTTVVAYVTEKPIINDPPVVYKARGTADAAVTVHGSNFYTHNPGETLVTFRSTATNEEIGCAGTSVSEDGTQLTCSLAKLPLAISSWNLTACNSNSLDWLAPSHGGFFAFKTVSFNPEPIIKAKSSSILSSTTELIIETIEGHGFPDGDQTQLELSSGSCSSVTSFTDSAIICHFDAADHPFDTNGTSVQTLNVTRVVSPISGNNYTISTIVVTFRPLPIITNVSGNLDSATIPPLFLGIAGTDFSSDLTENDAVLNTVDGRRIPCVGQSIVGNLLSCFVQAADIDSMTAGPIGFTITVQEGVSSDLYVWPDQIALPLIKDTYVDQDISATASEFLVNGTFFAKNASLVTVTFFPGSISCVVTFANPSSLRCSVSAVDRSHLPPGPIRASIAVQSEDGTENYISAKQMPYTNLRPEVSRTSTTASVALDSEGDSSSVFHISGAGFSANGTKNQLILAPFNCLYDESTPNPTSCISLGTNTFGSEYVLISSGYSDGILSVPLPFEYELVAGAHRAFINTTGLDDITRSTSKFYPQIKPRIRRDTTRVSFFDLRENPVISFSGVGFSPVKSENLVMYGGTVCTIISVNYTNIECIVPSTKLSIGPLFVSVFVRGADADSIQVREVIYVAPPERPPSVPAPFDDGSISSRNIALGIFFAGLALAILIGVGLFAYHQYKNRPPPPADPKAYVVHEDRIPAGEILAALSSPDDMEIEMDATTPSTKHRDDMDNLGSAYGEEEEDGDDYDDDSADDSDEDGLQGLDDSLGRH